MNNYNKNIIFDLAISGKDLTTKELLNQGLTNNDLDKLVKDKVLIRIEIGLYQVEVTSLNDYIMDLLKRGEIEKSLLGLNLNLQIDESLAETNYIMILALIMKEDYQKTFPYLRRLIESSDLDYLKEAIFLLYLLNYVTKLDEDLLDILKNIQIEDIVNLSSSDTYLDYLNDIKRNLFKKNFNAALKKISDSIDLEHINLYELVLKKIISKIKEERDTIENEILSFLNMKDYLNLSTYLETLKSKNILTNEELWLYNLTKTYLIIKEGKIPEIKNTNKSSIKTEFDAIKDNDFELALRIIKRKLNDKYPFKRCYIVLTDIVNLLKDFKISQGENIDTSIDENKLAAKTEFQKVIKLILNDDYDQAILEIKNYLKIYNREYLTVIILDLIKIAILEEKYLFLDVLRIFTWIAYDDFRLPISYYNNKLQLSLSKGNFQIAYLYADILKESNKILQTDLKDKIEENDLNSLNPLKPLELNLETRKKIEENYSNSLNNQDNRETITFKEYISEDDLKPNLNYGLQDFNTYVSFLNANNGDLDLLQLTYLLTDEDIDIIVLIYAEEYYKNNLVELGNRLMDRYSKSPNKTLKTILIYESILNKKNNYLNENRKGKGLALNRIPK